MRIAIVTESFLPTLNGVTTSVCRVVECLRGLGHQVLVIAPGPAPAQHAGARVHGLPMVSVRQFPVGVPTPALAAALDDFGPDVVHAASPFVLGARGISVARSRGIPSVAIYQTDVPAYIAQHGPGAIGRGAGRAAWRWVRRMHSRASLTLAPSRATLDDLRAHGVPRTHLWARGVDASLFTPDHREDPRTRDLRRRLAPNGEVLLGYVGRLAPEKELHRLVELATIPGTRIVVVGDGPSRSELTATLPGAAFLGRQEGLDLARAYAAFDVFVHTGTRETFGQTLQEAAATALPVVAPARGGPLDLVDHGVTGLLFDPDRPGALLEAVEPLVHDQLRRARLGAAGHQFVSGRTWSRLTDELVTHYGTARNPRLPLAS